MTRSISEEDVSVLISTYWRDRPDELQAALQSISAQTVTPAQVVVVLDGPVPEESQAIISAFASAFPGDVKICPIVKNVGLGNALAAGLAECTRPWVARLDADDLWLPTKLEAQIARAYSDASVDVITTWSGEFESDPRKIDRYNQTPKTHAEICVSLGYRNCVVHPSLFAKKAVLDMAGGYTNEFNFLEDYDLYLRLRASGARFCSIAKPLVLFRTTPEQRKRRGGLNYVRNELRFRWIHFVNGRLSFAEFIIPSIIMVPFRLAPGPLKLMLYRLVRRSA